MAGEAIVQLDDPGHMRALAHPTRVRILALLRTGGPQTAAMLGSSVEEAPGTISYHCKRLAAVGLIEAAPAQSGDRRERWWRAAHDGTSWNLAEVLDDPERYLALAAVDRTVSRFHADVHDRYVAQAPSFGKAWVEAAGGGDRVLRLVPAELAQLVRELDDVVQRWRARGERHIVGDGSEQVYVLTQGHRWPR